ncbi:MAG: MFS transporter [Actinobacteria bacterium]|nr:MFS transporter [Actinomycetota bacterium]
MSVIVRTRTRTVSTAGLPKGLGLVQFAAAAVDGLVLSSITVHALVRLQVGAGTIAILLSTAAALAMVTAPLLGAVADRVGLARAGAAYAALSGAALVIYAATRSLIGFAVAAVLFITAQAAAGSVRHAIAVVGVQGADRTQLRASMHTVLNAGFGCGTVLGVLVLANATDPVFSTAYGLGAAVSLVAAAATLRLSVPDRAGERRGTEGPWIALRDRPFAVAVALACLVQLTMPILSLLLPFWVLHTAAPPWTAAVALAVNTVLVISVQRSWASRLVDARTTARSALIAAVAMGATGVILAALPLTDSPLTAVGLVIAGVIVLTVGEVSGGAAVWQVALQHVDAAAEGRYQSAFSMSASGARILGPLLALPLLINAGSSGWIVLTLTMSAACLLVARRGLRRTQTHQTDEEE